MNVTRILSLVVLLLAFAFAPARIDPGSWPILVVPSASTVNRGDGVGLTITMNQAGTTSTTVTLTSSHPNLLPVPSQVVVPANSTTVYVEAYDPVLPFTDTDPTLVTITASANGQSASTTVTVQ